MAKYDLQLDLLFTALGDPTRRMVLSRLARGRTSVGELAAPLDMALPSLLGHLKKLEQAGLVSSVKEGRTRFYMLSPQAMQPAQDWLDQQRSLWRTRLNQLDDYVETLMQEAEHGPGPTD